MNKVFLLIGVIIATMSFTWCSTQKDSKVDSFKTFDDFFQAYVDDLEFQKSHMPDSLPWVSVDMSCDEAECPYDTSWVRKDDWILWGMDESESFVTNIPELKEDGTYCVVINGADNGIRIEHYFTPKDGSWILTKVIDMSM